MNWLEKALDAKEKMTPDTGFNVVAVDRMERPGEALYLVSHHSDAAAAEKARAAHEKTSGNKTYVYAAAAKKKK
jgi:hypothetical protein